MTPTAPPVSTPSQHVILTITLPRETTPAPYIQLPAVPQPTQQLTHRKLTLGHMICMILIVGATVAILVTITKFYI